MRLKTYHYRALSNQRVVPPPFWDKPILHKRGVTLITQEAENGDVTLFASKCHKMDSYCRKKGREEAMKNPPFSIPKGDFEKLNLLDVALTVHQRPDFREKVTEMIQGLKNSVVIKAPLIQVFPRT